jgi:hypothetical protein
VSAGLQAPLTGQPELTTPAPDDGRARLALALLGMAGALVMGSGLVARALRRWNPARRPRP